MSRPLRRRQRAFIVRSPPQRCARLKKWSGTAARFELEQLEINQLGPDRAVVVVVAMLTKLGSERLTGVSVVREDVRQAVIRATLGRPEPAARVASQRPLTRAWHRAGAAVTLRCERSASPGSEERLAGRTVFVRAVSAPEARASARGDGARSWRSVHELDRLHGRDARTSWTPLGTRPARLRLVTTTGGRRLLGRGRR